MPRKATPKYLQFNTSVSEIISEIKDGKRVLRMPAKAMPGGDTVMSRIKFQKQTENGTGVIDTMGTLEDRPVPLNHPFNEEGEMLSATSKRGILDHYAGAFTENVRWSEDAGGGRGAVAVDIMVYEDQVQGNPRAERLMEIAREADREGKPVDMSVGLYAWLTKEQGGNYDFVADIQTFDHFSLLDPEGDQAIGASRPEDGTGLFVASADGAERVEMLCFSAAQWEDPIDARSKGLCMGRIIEGAGRKLGFRKAEETPMADDTPKQEPAVETKAVEPEVTKAGLETFKQEILAAFDEKLKPLMDTNEEQAKAFKAEADTKRAEATEKVVKAGFMKEDQIDDSVPTSVLVAMASNVGEPGEAKDIPGDKAPEADVEDGEDPSAYDFQARLEAADEKERD